MDVQMPSDLRAKFAEYAKLRDYDLSCDRNKVYERYETRIAWRAWQAAHTLGVKEGMERTIEICYETSCFFLTMDEEKPPELCSQAPVGCEECASRIRSELRS